ncbi:LGFP repeat-containing protein [Methylocapsa palsarum]|uniref:LGFP repeat-containing protein n=2 Tax=Methylocapsa palsarum TaxID=1612308 RepID=A0A1I3Y6N3_9HYPH|nr:LGFP repeat-containing protein [Methylocapsa palsarum]
MRAKIFSLLSLLSTLAFCPSTASALGYCNFDYIPAGLIGDKYKELVTRSPPAPIGCPLSPVRKIPGGNGVYADFANGQIIWSPDQKMVIASYGVPDSNGAHSTNGPIKVEWRVTDQYRYDKFVVHAFSDYDHDPQPDDIEVGGGTQGSAEVSKNLPSGRIVIVVRGCDSNPPFKDVCRQGWSNPSFVDIGSIDVGHKAPGNYPVPGDPNTLQFTLDEPLLPAATVQDVRDSFEDRIRAALLPSCVAGLGGDLGESLANNALGKLYMSDAPYIPQCDQRKLIADANSALAAAHKTSEVGTDFETQNGTDFSIGAGTAVIMDGVAGPAGALLGGLFGTIFGATTCNHPGDYDMALVSLIPIVYEYYNKPQKLHTSVRNHIIHDLLTETGGVANVRTNNSICGVLQIHETENHMNMTESSRYLTNQLLLREAEAAHQKDPQSPALAAARQKYDNSINGMDKWMLQRLQGFLQSDFHEYNARPYARLSMRALHNLAEYAQIDATQRPVADAATMVLDYLAARFAASSNGLRRAATFRRHFDHRSYGPFFGNYSDEETWWGATMFGATQKLIELRHGRADWGSGSDMGQLAIGRYRVNDLIVDLLLRHENALYDGLAQTNYFQTYRHEGFEAYYHSNSYLISSGGIYTPLTGEYVTGAGHGAESFEHDSLGAALPTVVMPKWSLGKDRTELIRIDGHKDDDSRFNNCVGPNFACGLNPVVPDDLQGRFRQGPRPCAFAVAGLIADKWNQMGAEKGVFGCPTTAEANSAEGQGRFQMFERGEILASPGQNMVLAAFYKSGSNDIAVEWAITTRYSYDFFNVRWDKDGVNLGQWAVQHDDPNASRTGGNWTVPTKGNGKYRIVVEGCDGRPLSNSECRQGFSAPLILNLPGFGACTIVNGAWTFVDMTAGCDGLPDAGFFAAVNVLPCERDDCKFGFIYTNEKENDTLTSFEEKVIHNNGFTTYVSDGVNQFKKNDGGAVNFKPRHDANELGIVHMDDWPLNTYDMESLRLAKGDVVDADGKGCVVITNQSLHKALFLDFRNWEHPLERVVPLINIVNCQNVGGLTSP